MVRNRCLRTWQTCSNNVTIKIEKKIHTRYLLERFQEFVLAQEKKIEFDRVSDEAKDLLTEIEQATAVQLTPQVSWTTSIQSWL